MSKPNWFGLVKQVLPFVLSTIPQVPKDAIPSITTAVDEAEKSFHSGPDRKQHVMSTAGLTLDTLVKAGKLKAEAVPEAAAAISAGVDAGIHATNAIAAAKTKAST